LRELCGPHGGGTDVEDLPGLDEVVEGFHSFFDWCVGIVSMNLEEVDVGGTQALERSFDRFEDCGARKACGCC
jgi:hypothetical protein